MSESPSGFKSFTSGILNTGKNVVTGIGDGAKKGIDAVGDNAKKGLKVIPLMENLIDEENESDQEEEVEKEEEEIDMNEMKEGDYMVHVFIEYCKNIKMDAEDVVDPLVEVECLAQKKYTSTQKKIDSNSVVCWNEHLFFEFRNLNKNELEKAKISFRLLDKGFLTNNMMGFYEFDMSVVYGSTDAESKQEHVMLHEWFAMSNPKSEDYSEVTATIKASVAVAGPGDKQIAITEDPNLNFDQMHQAPHMTNKFYELAFHFFIADKIIAMDTMRAREKFHKSDVYIALNHRGVDKKTQVNICKKDSMCHINEEFTIPIQMPLQQESITFVVYDKETLADDEVICSLDFKVSDFIDGSKNGLFFWVNLYGAPAGTHGQYTKLMNTHPKASSFWRGRILCMVESSGQEVEHPKFIVKECEREMVRAAEQHLDQKRRIQYQLYVGMGIGMPFKDSQYQIKVRIAEHEITSDVQTKLNSKNSTYCRWNQMFPDYKKRDKKDKARSEEQEHDTYNGVITVPYQNVKNIGLVFFYLYHKGKRVSYAKEPMAQFIDPGSQPTKLKWMQLRADRACGKVKEDHKAGVISVMLSVVDITNLRIINFKDQERISYNLKKGGAVHDCHDGCEDGDDEKAKLIDKQAKDTSSDEEPAFDMPLGQSQRRTLGVQGGVGDKVNPWKDFFAWFDKGKGSMRLNAEKLRIHIFQCRNLPSADKNGLSDPFVYIHDDGKPVGLEYEGRPQNQTDVIEQNLNPPFYQTLEINTESIRMRDKTNSRFIPPFVLDVYDTDENSYVGDIFKSTFLGRTIIGFNEKLRYSTDNRIQKPEWYPLQTSFDNHQQGEILVSFSIPDENDFAYEQKPEKTEILNMVKFTEQEVSINVLGLRSLVSTGIIPVKKSFIKFNIASLIPPKWGTSVTNIRTAPGAPGPNPTLNTLINFKVPLPRNKLFSPVLSCQVYDSLLKGTIQPEIGTFIIPMGQLMHELLDKRVKDQTAFEEVLWSLKCILQEIEPGSKYVDANKGLSREVRQKIIRQKFAEDLQSEESETESSYVPKIDEASCGLLDSIVDAEEEEKLDEIRKEQIAAVFKVNGDGSAPISWQQKAEEAARQIEMKNREGRSIDKKELSPAEMLRQTQSQFGNSGGFGLRPTTKIKTDAATKKMLSLQMTEMEDREKRMAKEACIRDEQEFEERRHACHKNVIYPDYKWDKTYKINREEKAAKPPPTLYLALGYDRDEVLLKNPDGENHMANVMKNALVTKINQKASLIQEESKQEDAPQSQLLGDRPQISINTVAAQISSIRTSKQLDAKKEINPEDVVEDSENFKGSGVVEKKHYRRFYNDELEQVKEIFSTASPFSTFQIIRGSARGNEKSLKARLKNAIMDKGLINTEKKVGTVKALIEIEGVDSQSLFAQEKMRLITETLELVDVLAKKRAINFTLGSSEYLEKLMYTEGRNEIESSLMEPLGISHLKITKKLADFESMNILKRKLLDPQTCVIRVYMITGHNLASRDIGSPSDPYLILGIGDEKKNERQHWELDEENPTWHKSFDFQGDFPGCAPLIVNVMDYDDLFGDDEIGTTSVDLEDRYFMADWASMKDKPVETRQLYHQSFKMSQGLVRMWVEISTSQQQSTGQNPVWDIMPRVADEVEVRVCIFDADNVKMMDAEDTTDAYVRCFFNPRDALETDTHYRLQPNNTASWNYRLVFRQKHLFEKTQMQLLTIQAYDRDWLKSNDFIGSFQLDLLDIIEDVAITKKQSQLSAKYYESQMKAKKAKSWYALKQDVTTQIEFDSDDLDGAFKVKLFAKDKDGKQECNAVVRMLIDVVPVAIADLKQNQVGAARDNPNHSPYLPPPIGRISFTMNPMKLFNMLLGPKARAAIKKWFWYVFCTVLCIGICYYIVPSVFANLMTFWI